MIAVEVAPDSAEYWDFFDKLRATPNPAHAKACPTLGQMSDVAGMQDAWITKLERIQNTDLYTFNDHHRQKLLKTMRTPQLGGKGFVDGTYDVAKGTGEVMEVESWHGTGSFSAANIYEDRQVRFFLASSSSVVAERFVRS